MDTATVAMITLLISLLVLLAAFGLEQYSQRRQHRAKHAH